MKLHEYQGKEIFSSYGIPVPEGRVIEKKEELASIDLKFPWVMKAQILTGGRGRAGGIGFASGIDEAEKIFYELMGRKINGCIAKKILVEEKLDIEREFYLSVTVDRDRRCPIVLFSRHGGIDIGITKSIRNDGKREGKKGDIVKIYVNPLVGIQDYQMERVDKDVADIIRKTYAIFEDKECELVEINPLAYAGGRLVAADSKIVINDNALFRHPEIPEENEELTPLEREARRSGISFVQLDGNVGVIANGAGLTMATLDALDEYGGKGMFLDLSGTDDPEKVKSAFRILKKARADVIFVNLFGSITKCDTVAYGIRNVIDEEGIDCPVVARIRGTNEENAAKILEGKVIAIRSFKEAAKMAAELGGR